MQPAYAANMWNEALNKRLGTEVNRVFFKRKAQNITAYFTY